MGFVTNSKPGGPTWNHPGRVLTTGDPSGGLDHWQQQHHVAEIALLRRKAGDLARPPKRPGVPWEKHRILMAFVVEKPWKTHKRWKNRKNSWVTDFFYWSTSDLCFYNGNFMGFPMEHWGFLGVTHLIWLKAVCCSEWETQWFSIKKHS